VAGAGGMRRARRGPAPRRRTHPGRTGRRRRSAGAAAPGTLYVYALLRARPRGGVPRGLGGEPVRLVGGAGLLAAVGALPAPPAPTPAALRRHDATVRRLAARAGAVLPVRFGTVVASAADLAARLAPLAPAARRALDTVAGCEQMTLRIFGPPDARAEAAGPDLGRGPGARYLAARLRARAAPEAAPLRAALAGLVRAERVERHDRPPLLVSLYHLIRRGDARRYRRAVARAAPALDRRRARVSGPWPPYAFGPDAVE